MCKIIVIKVRIFVGAIFFAMIEFCSSQKSYCSHVIFYYCCNSPKINKENVLRKQSRPRKRSLKINPVAFCPISRKCCPLYQFFVIFVNKNNISRIGSTNQNLSSQPSAPCIRHQRDCKKWHFFRGSLMIFMLLTIMNSSNLQVARSV